MMSSQNNTNLEYNKCPHELYVWAHVLQLYKTSLSGIVMLNSNTNLSNGCVLELQWLIYKLEKFPQHCYIEILSRHLIWPEILYIK